MRGRWVWVAGISLTAMLVLALRSCGQESDPKALFLSATASFHAGDYAAAERKFQACRAQIGEHAAVDYNLALTYLRLGSLGRARVYLERCLEVSPRDGAAREQLRLLLARLNEVEAPPPSWVHAVWQALRRSVTVRGAVTLAAAVNVLAAGLVGAWLVTGRRCFGRGSLAALLVLPLVWALAGSKLVPAVRGHRAIVIAESAVLRGGPGDGFGEIERLSEGQAVTIVARGHLSVGPGLSLVAEREEGGLWCEVRAPSGARGYVRRGLIEPI